MAQRTVYGEKSWRDKIKVNGIASMENEDKKKKKKKEQHYAFEHVTDLEVASDLKDVAKLDEK